MIEAGSSKNVDSNNCDDDCVEYMIDVVLWIRSDWIWLELHKAWQWLRQGFEVDWCGRVKDKFRDWKQNTEHRMHKMNFAAVQQIQLKIHKGKLKVWTWFAA